MKNVINSKLLVIIAILIIAFLLRFKDYAGFPVFGETQDEVAWTWLGTGLLQGNPPTSWSGTNIDGYNLDYVWSFGETKYRIVSPYLDNPYLFSLIPGSLALMTGYSGIEIPSLAVIRFPMLLIGTLNVYLLYLLITKIKGRSYGLLGALLYATIPTAVFSSRVVVAENALITVMLLALLAVTNQEKLSIKRAMAVGLLCGLGVLMKVAGLVIPLALALSLYHQKQIKSAGVILGTALVIGSLYPLYGFLSAPDIFISVLTKQSTLDGGLAGLFHLIIYPQLVQKTLLDGWLFFGMGSLLAVLLHHHRHQLSTITAMILGWLGFLVIATPEVTSHGWYQYPLIPLLIGAMIFSLDLWKQRLVFFPIFALIVTLPMLRLFLLTQSLFIGQMANRIIIATVFLPLLLRLGPKKIQTLNLILVAVTIILNCLMVYHFDRTVYWEDSLHFYPIRTGE